MNLVKKHSPLGVTGAWPHAQDSEQVVYDQLLYNEEEHYSKSQISDKLNGI